MSSGTMGEDGGRAEQSRVEQSKQRRAAAERSAKKSIRLIKLYVVIIVTLAIFVVFRYIRDIVNLFMYILSIFGNSRG